MKYLLKKAVQDKKKKLGLNTDIKKEAVAPNAAVPMSTKVTPTSKLTADTTKQTSNRNKPASKPARQRKPLPIAVKRFVWQRANACCEYRDSKTEIRCQSKFALEPDHIISLALGGTDEVSNLQLLCRVHNSRRAIKTFGIRRD